MRQLTNLELATAIVAGAGVETYPPSIPGYELIGWEQTLLYYREESRVIERGFLTDTVYVYNVPVYEMNPIYAPIYYIL